MLKEYSLDDVGSFLKAFDAESKKAMVKGLQQAAQMTRTHVIEVIEGMSPKPVHQGFYRAAWIVENISDGAVLRNSLPYAAVIEYGAAPGRIVPSKALIAALVVWCRQKLGVGKDATSVAWAVATNLRKRGLAPRGVFEKASKMIPEFIQKACAAELEKL